jgi:hypothetical protein
LHETAHENDIGQLPRVFTGVVFASEGADRELHGHNPMLAQLKV